MTAKSGAGNNMTNVIALYILPIFLLKFMAEFLNKYSINVVGPLNSLHVWYFGETVIIQIC